MQEAYGPEIAGMKAGGEQAAHPAPAGDVLTYAILHVLTDQNGAAAARVIDHVQIPVKLDDDGKVAYGTPAAQSVYRHGDAMDAAKIPQDGTYISVALDSDSQLWTVETVRKVNRRYHD